MCTLWYTSGQMKCTLHDNFLITANFLHTKLLYDQLIKHFGILYFTNFFFKELYD